MPASSIRDLVIKDDDIVVGTHGRSFWILDDITPLRQISDQVAAADAFLFKPQLAHRVRWNMNTDTPLPQEEPAGRTRRTVRSSVLSEVRSQRLCATR
jgi:hypothetical protein